MAEAKYGRPDSISVKEFHVNSDVDSSTDAQHHTIGSGVNQVASGAHDHDGQNSPFLLADVTLTGAKGTAACDSSIIAALVRLGATDSTT